MEGDVIVLGLPSRFQRIHLPTIEAESTAVREALAHQLGRPVRVRVVLDDTLALSGDYPDNPSDGGDDLAEELAVPGPPEGRRGVDSPVGLVIETFGATVESEIVRE